MGEMAEAALWAEMNGMRFEDMGPEDWLQFYKDQEPPEAFDVYLTARLLASDLDEHIPGPRSPTDTLEDARTRVLTDLFPKLDQEAARKLADGLTALLELGEPDPDEEESILPF